MCTGKQSRDAVELGFVMLDRTFLWYRIDAFAIQVETSCVKSYNSKCITSLRSASSVIGALVCQIR